MTLVWVNFGVSRWAFHLTDRLAYSLFRPKLDTFAKWIPWTLTTTAVSVVVSDAFLVQLNKRVFTDRWSFEGWTISALRALIREAGVWRAQEAGRMLLPCPGKVGKKYVWTSLARLGGGSALVSIECLVGVWKAAPFGVAVNGCLKTGVKPVVLW
jgi:hypothetical protein